MVKKHDVQSRNRSLKSQKHFVATRSPKAQPQLSQQEIELKLKELEKEHLFWERKYDIAGKAVQLAEERIQALTEQMRQYALFAQQERLQRAEQMLLEIERAKQTLWNQQFGATQGLASLARVVDAKPAAQNLSQMVQPYTSFMSHQTHDEQFYRQESHNARREIQQITGLFWRAPKTPILEQAYADLNAQRNQVDTAFKELERIELKMVKLDPASLDRIFDAD